MISSALAKAFNAQIGHEFGASMQYVSIAAHFQPPAYEALPGQDAGYLQARTDNRVFDRWAERNVHAHRQPGYAASRPWMGSPLLSARTP